MTDGVETAIKKLIFPKYPFLLGVSVLEVTTPGYFGLRYFKIKLKGKLQGNNIEIYNSEAVPKIFSILRMFGMRDFSSDVKISSIANIFYSEITGNTKKS